MSRWLSASACLVTAVLFAACSSQSASDVGTTTLSAPTRIELGIYSGRADPQWQLTADQAQALDQLIASLPTQSGVPASGGLGYHGFSIVRSDSTQIAYQGTVAPSDPKAETYRVDATFSVERFLLDTGRGVLNDVEIAEVTKGLPSP
ncbi:MAG: hypothetical protein F2659_00850 [Actinobacteria bacterium]|uniref:Unannotated protein n=1 Tax=freshwater metagenome TaxID=449393 RepID=A0A6J6N1W1_9ZZZZ|nr:hypothetical protein [Actinomycetota bacterium]